MHSDHTHEKGYLAKTRGHAIHGWAGLYDTLWSILTLGRSRRLRRRVLDLDVIQFGPDEDILDVGCGTGSYAVEIKQRQDGNGKVVGIDPSSNMIEIASRKAAKANVSVDFQVGVIENLEFPENRFDAVFSSLMVHHLPDDLKRAGMTEVYRVLKPAGRLIILDVESKTFSLTSLLHGYFHRQERPSVADEYSQYLEASGFQEVESGKTGVRSLIYVTGKKPAN